VKHDTNAENVPCNDEMNREVREEGKTRKWGRKRETGEREENNHPAGMG
jgi:hypothetical protein